eukprot:jgi/Botrbrau1/21490/Bobra.0668s0001.1
MPAKVVTARKMAEGEQAVQSGEGIQAQNDGKEAYEIGEKAMCAWTQGSLDKEYRAVEIVERKLGDSSSGNLYYVHYIDYDKRLDEWVGRNSYRHATGLCSRHA